ncbi:MAG: MgtC/SapB family protein [Muribaculaceae bacterium]|nr:MgtC/SapB family protein [Muribaculaceae bacterium]
MNQLLDSMIAQINGTEITLVSSVYKLFISMLLGCFVGLERKRKGQMAGIRTFALISMGATLAMILSVYIPQEYLGLKNGDPGRVAAQVITGIGFLGAGAIIQMKGSVRGLTTAAGIWMAATIGMAVGVGLYLLSMVATLFVLLILTQFDKFEHRVHMGTESRAIRVKVNGIIHSIDCYREVLNRNHVHLSNVYVEYDYNENVTRLNLLVLVKDSTDYIQLFDDLKRDCENIITISLTNTASL